MKGSVLLCCAFACTKIVYGTEEMSDVEIVQNSTIIPKDMFEVVPPMSDMAVDDADDTEYDSMDQDDSMDTNNDQNNENETSDMLAQYGVDSRPYNDERTMGPSTTAKKNSHTKDRTKKDSTLPKEKKHTTQKAPKKSASTTTTTRPLFMAPPVAKKDKDLSCKQVAIKVPATCYKDETLEIPYQCHKDVTKTECKKVDIEVPSTCKRTEYTDEEYPCEKTRNVCRDVVKQCERIEYKEEEYVCAPPTCKPVKKQVPSTCTRKVKVKKPVPCPPPKKCKKIKMIDQSYPCGTRAVCTDELKTDAVCHRTVQVNEEYECLKQTEKPSLFSHFGKTSGQDTEAANEDNVIRKENCKDVTIQVASECTKSEVEKKPYPCLKTEEKQVCKNVTVRVPGVCTKSVSVDELYDCQDSTLESTALDTAQGRVVCQDEESSVSSQDKTTNMDGTTDTSRKHRQLKHSKKSQCKRACKVRKVMREEPYKCEKTQVVKECNTVPTQVPSTCFHEKTVEKKYACRLPKTVEQCERVYTLCTRKKTVNEPYTCEKKEKKCENVPQTCFKKVPVEYEEDCFIHLKGKSEAETEAETQDDDDMTADSNAGESQKKKHLLLKRQKAPQVCTETVEEDQEYECKKTIQVEECSEEKLCKKRVAVPRFEECTEQQCEDVLMKSTCSRRVPVATEYECMKKDRVEQCEDKTHKTLATCIKTITKPKPYLCTETQYQTICTGPKTKK